MRRTLARAAPVALAFDCNLATFGFPYDEGRRRESKDAEAPDLRTPVEVADFVADSTTIGAGGDYFRELAAAGRFHTFPFPGKGGGFPPQLGRAIVTSEHVQPHATAVRPSEVASELHGGASQVVVFGLGPRGLPKEVLQGARHCLELTGRNIGFETATALAALPAIIHTHLDHLAKRGPPGGGY